MAAFTTLPTRSIARVLFLPVMTAAGALVVWLAGTDAPLALVMTLLAAVAVSFATEHLIAYDRTWNDDHGDRQRDTVHAIVNESLNAASLAALPLVASTLVVADIWPATWPFAFQVALALIVFDAGITLAHWASHRNRWLWSFHAVHHSVTRFYGLNGLMKHPVHQAVEMTAGVAVLVAVGLPEDVAAALAGLTVVQLLLQHSNVDYAHGRLGQWWALNAGHRLHHLSEPGKGDTNFGLFTLVWDRLLGTYTPGYTRPTVTSADIGITGHPDYPAPYIAQLRQPFRDLAESRR